MNYNSGGFGNISFGGTIPIMLYDYDGKSGEIKNNRDEARATYKELFNLVKRMNEAKKPLSLLINEDPNLENNNIVIE